MRYIVATMLIKGFREMILAYLAKNKFAPQEINAANAALLQDALWIDLISPTREEENEIEKFLNIDIPTREEMVEIEISSRLFKEEGILFMTAIMLPQANTLDPQYDAVTFALSEKQLITIRYIEPLSFKLFSSKLQKMNRSYNNPAEILIDLLNATIDRLADILEMLGNNLDHYSKTIFRTDESKQDQNKMDYQQLMQNIGITGDINSKVNQSLLTFHRLITFFGQKSPSPAESEAHLDLVTLNKDIESLRDHGTFLSNKVTFLLDATLGMVSIEQNKIIKIFSVAAVIFLPPTLIASIYGMNFKFMPELAWHGGYYVALGLMLLSAWLPYKYFKSRKWL